MMDSHGLDLNTITAEFEALKGLGCGDNSKLFESALLPQNSCKNRYYNILPIEETRVRLNPHCACDEDYINANYIDGEVGGSRHYYIAAQAPLQNTVNDFWRMIWEERCPVIVCLTRLQEQGRERTAHYWPEGEEIKQYGKIQVLHNTTLLYKNIVVRSFILWKEGDPINTQETVHLHHQDWPDFGTPVDSSSIRTLAVLLTSLKERGARLNAPGPAVIHCSAGVGRAGTFISIHIVLRKLERLLSTGFPVSFRNLPVSIKETVARLREQRFGTVCTRDQYLFIYRTILDALQNEEKRRQISPKPRLRRSFGNQLSAEKENLIAASQHSKSVLTSSAPSFVTPVKDKAGVTAFLDILLDRDSSCSLVSEATELLSSPRSQIS